MTYVHVWHLYRENWYKSTALCYLHRTGQCLEMSIVVAKEGASYISGEERFNIYSKLNLLPD
jgi:hypothetical protein